MCLSPAQVDPFYSQGESLSSDDQLDQTWVTVFGYLWTNLATIFFFHQLDGGKLNSMTAAWVVRLKILNSEPQLLMKVPYMDGNLDFTHNTFGMSKAQINIGEIQNKIYVMLYLIYGLR